MKKNFTTLLLAMLLSASLVACGSDNDQNSETLKAETQKTESQIESQTEQAEDLKIESTLKVEKVEGLSDSFFLGADISSLLSLEESGREFYAFDGKEQDLFKTLDESGINCIRVRVWNNPFDAQGNGYGGGNCTVDTAIELGKRASAYGMGLLVDFHYSDFWADPGKQQAPKEWEKFCIEQKEEAIYNYTTDSLRKIIDSGIAVQMVQVGNEITGGICGETQKENVYRLVRSAAKAVRDIDKEILIAVHYTNPEWMVYGDYANDLKTYEVDYDVFATSYYPEYHGTIDNLKEQLKKAHDIGGKKVMIAETSWSRTSTNSGTYDRSIQGQADEIRACVQAMAELGECAIGVFYWEPAWIDVEGASEQEKHTLREQHGAGWASSYAGEYDKEDAGKYYGATACIPSALFDEQGYPLESLKTFLYVRYGTKEKGEE